MASKNGALKKLELTPEQQRLSKLLYMPRMGDIDSEGLDTTAQALGYYNILIEYTQRQFQNLSKEYQQALQTIQLLESELVKVRDELKSVKEEWVESASRRS